MQLTQLQRTANQREVGQLSWVELCRYKRAFKSFHLNDDVQRITGAWRVHIDEITVMSLRRRDICAKSVDEYFSLKLMLQRC